MVAVIDSSGSTAHSRHLLARRAFFEVLNHARFAHRLVLLEHCVFHRILAGFDHIGVRGALRPWAAKFR